MAAKKTVKKTARKRAAQPAKTSPKAPPKKPAKKAPKKVKVPPRVVGPRELYRVMHEYDPELAPLAQKTLDLVRKHAPSGYWLVWRAPDCFAVSISGDETIHLSILHVYIRNWEVTLGFNYGNDLKDPRNMLLGYYNKYVRHILVDHEEVLEDKYVVGLLKQSLRNVGWRAPKGTPPTIVFRRIDPMPKKRPPRPPDPWA